MGSIVKRRWGERKDSREGREGSGGERLWGRDLSGEGTGREMIEGR